MQARGARGIGNVVQMATVVGLVPLICAPFLIGGAEWILWLKLGHWPDWSPLALGWWNPEEYTTGWPALNRGLDALAGSNLLMLTFLALMALGAFGRLLDWRERRAFQKWYHRRALTPHV